MSVISHARSELKRINFGEEDTAAMVRVMELLFNQWDSGGAVHAVFPILQRLIACKPLTPLTGEDDEWFDHGNGVFQNKRMGSVFKDPRFHDGKLAYDIDNPAGPREAIAFPYWPERVEVADPVVHLAD